MLFAGTLVVRFFRAPNAQEYKERNLPRAVFVLAIMAMTPVFAFTLDWRVGLFVLGSFVALGFGVWRVSRGR